MAYWKRYDKQLAVLLTTGQHDWLVAHAAEQKVSAAEILRIALDAYREKNTVKV